MSEYQLTSEEEKNLAEMKQFWEEMKKIPESEKREISQELQDRMQSEAEAGYVDVTEEQRQRWRKQWLTDE